VVAGVGAGISATFFAQLAAVFFALEIVLGGFGGALYAVPVLIAVAASALFTFALGGMLTQYEVPAAVGNWNVMIPLYIGVALLAALAAIVYVNLLPKLKTFWLKVKLPFWAKAALAGLIVGVVGLWLPGVFGTGLSQMKEIFSGTAVPIGMLMALLVAKIFLTPNSLGAGFVGGVIGPALLIGSALGAAFGDVVLRLFPGIGVSPIAFAMVATAAMLAGTFHAPIFGAMMIFEMNKDYGMLFPLLLAAGIGYAIARFFQTGSAYTFAFPGMGIHLEPGTFAPLPSDSSQSDK
jgi:CIC family chloride channel protein